MREKNNICDYLRNTHGIFLNEQQQKGIVETKQNLLLLAVPGSGKTTVLVSRIAHLICNEEVSSKQILTLTYSRETARDMKHRFQKLFGELIEEVPEFRTIHSFCLLILKRYAQMLNRTLPKLISEHVYAGLKQRVLRDLYQKHNQEYLTDDLLETLDRQISFTKNRMLDQIAIQKREKEIKAFSLIYQEYERFKKENGLMDYDDMLSYTYDIFCRFPKILNEFQERYTYINIDEAQDTSLLQHRIIQCLSEKNYVFMVGDEDQSIYSFRGASPKELLEFQKNYRDGLILKMEQNYRSHQDIIEKANDFIKQNKQRYEKNMFCDNNETGSTLVCHLKDYSYQSQEIVRFIKDNPKEKTLAVLFRNNDSSVPIIDLLYQQGIEFYMKETQLSYFNSFVMRDMIAYFMLSYYPCDLNYFKQIYYKIGLSKGAYAYVEKNINDYQSVFDCAARISSLSDYRKNQMQYYHSAFKRLKDMKPVKAIRFILNELNYQYYLDHKLNDGFMKTGANQKVNTAIQLAQGLDDIHAFLDKLDELPKALAQKQNINKHSNVTLSTLHSSKGMEYDIVIMADILKDIIPMDTSVNNQLLGNSEDMENEVRLFYVGVTRAKEKLIFFQSHAINETVASPSRFIDRFLNGNPLHYQNKLNASEKIMLADIPSLVGVEIYHNHFGNGVVKEQDGDHLEILFEDKIQRIISYSICMNNKIIKIKN